MSIVAPISATSALVPFVAGIATGERPAALQLLGVALAAAGVVLAAIEPERPGETIGVAALPNEPAVEPAAVRDGSAGRCAATPSRRDQRLAVGLALLAALCIGLVLLGYDATAKTRPAVGHARRTHVVGHVVLRAVRGAAAARAHVARGRALRSIAVGLLDTSANGLFSLATTQGYLSLVAVLGSVYPVVTVLLAFIVLDERIAKHQMAGVVAALAGVALIAAG